MSRTWWCSLCHQCLCKSARRALGESQRLPCQPAERGRLHTEKAKRERESCTWLLCLKEPLFNAGKMFDGREAMLYTKLVTSVATLSSGTLMMYRDDQKLLRGAHELHPWDGQERCHQSHGMFGLTDHPYKLEVPE